MRNYKAELVVAFLFIGLFILSIGVLIGYSIDNSQETTERISDDKMLIIIEDHIMSSGYCIAYDKDTRVIYYRGTGNGQCLFPLYNADGTLKIYRR